MFKSLLEIIKSLLGLAKDTQDNKDNIKSVEIRLDTVTDTLKHVIFELQRLKENEAHEREKVTLRLENMLLRSERPQIPSNVGDDGGLSELQKQLTELQVEVEKLKRRMEQLGK